MIYATENERFTYVADMQGGLIRSLTVTAKDAGDWIRRMDLRDGEPLNELERLCWLDSGKSPDTLKGEDVWSRSPRNQP